jgi:hypothetical protein
MLTCSLLAEISRLLATTTEQRSSKPILAMNALVSYSLYFHVSSGRDTVNQYQSVNKKKPSAT